MVSNFSFFIAIVPKLLSSSSRLLWKLFFPTQNRFFFLPYNGEKLNLRLNLNFKKYCWDKSHLFQLSLGFILYLGNLGFWPVWLHQEAGLQAESVWISRALIGWFRLGRRWLAASRQAVKRRRAALRAPVSTSASVRGGSAAPSQPAHLPSVKFNSLQVSVNLEINGYSVVMTTSCWCWCY